MENNNYLVKVAKEIRTSQKTGRQYQVLVIYFKNGYIMETFLTTEQQFILNDVPLNK